MSMPNLAPQVAIPETFNLSSLSVSPEVVAADTPATVWFTITNNGSEEDDYMIGVLVDDQMEATVDGSLPPLASQTHQVSLLRNTPGTYVVGVGPLIDSFTVEGPNIQLTSLKTWPKNVGLGDPVDISLLVTNEGGFPGDYDITVKVGNTAVATFTGILPAGKSKPLLVTYRESQPGTHTVSAGGLSDRFIVIPPYVSRIREAPFIVPATTQAVDDLGHTLPITGDQITHDETKEFVIFHFPVALADGRRLIKFHDFVTGIEVVDNELRIPIRDERAREVLRIVGEVIATEGAGNVARVKVKKESLHLLVRERQIDLTLSDPRLGQVAVSADASLLDLPRIAELQIVAKGTLPPEAHASFEQLVRVQGNTIAEAGFVVEFDAQNLVNGIDVGSVTITLKLGRSWVQSQSGGQESIRIIRRAADGTYLALQTSCTGPDSEERYACTAISPEGWSTFALLSLAPDLQQVRFSDLTVTPAVAEPGEAVEITLRASNDGDEAATVTPLMEVNGKAEAAVTVTLQPGQTQNVAFLKAQEQEGTYRIEVAGLSARFEVATSLDSTLLQASDLRVLPKTVLPEKPTSISVQVQNTGQQAGKFNVPLKVNGLLADVQPVALGPGQSRLVNFIVARTQRGKYAIEVLDLKDTFEVAPALTPAVFKVTSLTVDEERTPPAVPVTVTALVSNASEQGGLFLGILQVNGEVEETRQVFVGGCARLP